MIYKENTINYKYIDFWKWGSLMILLEIKRGLSRTSFRIILIIVSIMAIICAFENKSYRDSSDILNIYMKAYLFTPADYFMIFRFNSIETLFLQLMPLLSCICYADTYFEDRKNGFLKFIYTRQEKKVYLKAKYIANFILSGLAISIPLKLNYIILLLRFPNIEVNEILGNTNIKMTLMFPDLYYSNTTIYIFLWIFIFFLYSGIFASIGLSLSIFMKNRIVALFIPLILFNIIDIFLEAIDKFNFYPVQFLGVSSDKSFSIIAGEFLVLLVITFITFYIGGNKDEVY